MDQPIVAPRRPFMMIRLLPLKSVPSVMPPALMDHDSFAQMIPVGSSLAIHGTVSSRGNNDASLQPHWMGVRAQEVASFYSVQRCSYERGALRCLADPVTLSTCCLPDQDPPGHSVVQSEEPPREALEGWHKQPPDKGIGLCRHAIFPIPHGSSINLNRLDL